jgi:hypothetical protein
MKLENSTSQRKVDSMAGKITALILTFNFAYPAIQAGDCEDCHEEAIYREETTAQGQHAQASFNRFRINFSHNDRLCRDSAGHAGQNSYAGASNNVRIQRYQYDYRNEYAILQFGSISAFESASHICERQRFIGKLGFRKRGSQHGNHSELQSLPNDKDGRLCAL